MSDESTLARIYRPARNVMQSGKHGNNLWQMDFEPSRHRYREGLMGWTASKETLQQIRMSFPSKEDAISYAEAHNIPYVVLQDHSPKARPKSYAANFLRNRGL